MIAQVESSCEPFYKPFGSSKMMCSKIMSTKIIS
jgi:hypothetical protein